MNAAKLRTTHETTGLIASCSQEPPSGATDPRRGTDYSRKIAMTTSIAGGPSPVVRHLKRNIYARIITARQQQADERVLAHNRALTRDLLLRLHAESLDMQRLLPR